jgi:hypothetical protein
MRYIFLLVLFCCSPKAPKADPKPVDKKLLAEQKYVELLTKATDSFDFIYHWPDPLDCDGVLFAGLAYAGGVAIVDYTASERTPGHLYRTPVEPCSDPTSRDMATGYLWSIWAAKDCNAWERFKDYLEMHSFVIDRLAEGFSSQMTGNLIGILGRMGQTMCDKETVYAAVPGLYTKNEKYYQKRLATLNILLNHSVAKYALYQTSQAEVEVLCYNRDTDPTNPLYEASCQLFTDGDYTRAIDLFLDDTNIPLTWSKDWPMLMLAERIFTGRILLENLAP